MEVDLGTMSVVDAPIEVPAVVSDAVDEPIAQPEGTPEVAQDVTPEPESPDPEAEKADEPDKVETEVDEADATPEPVTFDSAAPDFKEKVTEALDKYELPQEVSAVIEALTAKAENDTLAPFAEYAKPDATPEVVAETVKTLLDRQVMLDSYRVEDERLRPDTDKFAASLNEIDPEKSAWLYYDFGKLPSVKYQGVNKFEEGIVDALHIPGEAPQATLTRYHETMAAVKSGASVSVDIPSFIPAHLKDAFWSLAKEDREEYELYDPSMDNIEYDEYNRPFNKDEAVRNRKLAMLANIQDGIDSRKQMAMAQIQDQAHREQTFSKEVQTTVEKFYDSFRTAVTDDVLKNVKFSDNPKLNAILANQNVAFLGQAMEANASGEAARAVLSEAGIKFDAAKAQQLDKDIQIASVALAQARKIKDDAGNPLNPTEVNRATHQLKKATEAFQTFAKDIVEQQARLVSTGKAEDVKQAAEKIKIAPKARAAVKGVGTTAKAPQANPHPYGTTPYYEWYADRELEQQAKKAAQYA